MSFGFGFGLPSWQTLSGGFSPASLFSAGEQGAWYDPSDLTTLFTDSAGTTPVTAVEQFVGLMLDKSKGVPLPRYNLMTFTENFTDAIWTTASATVAVPTKVAADELAFPAITGASDFSIIRQVFPSIAAGYTAAVDLKAKAAGDVGKTIWLYINDGTGITLVPHVLTANYVRVSLSKTTVATATCFFTIGVLGSTFGGANQAAVTVNVRNADVRLTADIAKTPTYQPVLSFGGWTPGNHAFQTNDPKRPKLAARYNLLTYTEQFDNAVWTKTAGGAGTDPTITANTAVAPNGTLTADTYAQSASPGSSRLFQDVTVVSGQTVTLSVSQKQKTGTWGRLILIDSTNSNGCVIWFNLATGQEGTVTTFGSGAVLVGYSVVSQGNSWYRLTLTGSTTGTVARFFMDIVDANNSGTRLANGEMFVWGADLRPANQATGLIGPTYQRVVDAATYDTAGFLPYLEFNGLTWSMSTGSIDFTATDKMTVWAGVNVTAASGGTTQMFAELSTNAAGAANGTFELSPYPTDGTSKIGNNRFRSRGTAIAAALNTTLTAEPRTNVLAAVGNISGDICVLRSNGVQVASSTTDQGAGNYGNHPLFIGARDNTSLFFNGWLTSLIIRGAQSTQSQIEATEAWVNQRTGAY